MAENDSRVDQGRKYHVWFGHGTKPDSEKALPPSKDALPSLQDRIHNLGYTLAAGLPPSKRHHAVARLDAADQGRLTRVMTGVVHALPLGPRLIPLRVLGTSGDAPGIASFVNAGAVIRAADSNADVREIYGFLLQDSMTLCQTGNRKMEKDEVLSLVKSIYTGSTDEAVVYPILDKLEEALPHGDICDLIFHNMRNLTPEQVVDEALKREAEYARQSGER